MVSIITRKMPSMKEKRDEIAARRATKAKAEGPESMIDLARENGKKKA